MWTTERLVLEPLGAEHAPGLFTALDDARVGAYIGGPDVTTLEALEHRIRRLHEGPPADRLDERWVNIAVILGTNPAEDPTGDRPVIGPVIGRLEATVHDDWAEIAYLLGPAYWGAGYATEAVGWFLGHLERPELWAAVHPANEPSRRLLQRLRFERVDAPTRPVSSYDDGDLAWVWRR
jgi:RimJ/RimL family protein N-acetyltransferase